MGRKKKDNEDDYPIIYSWSDGDEDDDDEMPEGCAACGGPWPSCKISCSLYDDDDD